jgi:hypothetical protein
MRTRANYTTPILARELLVFYQDTAEICSILAVSRVNGFLSRRLVARSLMRPHSVAGDDEMEWALGLKGNIYA